MDLMGRYAAANHALIHRRLARSIGAGILLGAFLDKTSNDTCPNASGTAGNDGSLLFQFESG